MKSSLPEFERAESAMDISLARHVMTDLRPPIHPVKVLPTKMGEADRLSRTRAAVWIYGSSTLLTMLLVDGVRFFFSIFNMGGS